MRNKSYRFELDLTVHDECDLYSAAWLRAAEEGVTSENAVEVLGTPGEPDVEACLVMLLDPGSLDGCSIYGSAAQGTWA